MEDRFWLRRAKKVENFMCVKIINLKNVIIFHGINQKQKQKKQKRKKISRVLHLYYNCVTKVLHLRYN